MAQPKKAFSPSIFGKDATVCVRERRMSSFYIISMAMMGWGWSGCARACACAHVCARVVTRFSAQSCNRILLDSLY